MFTLQNHSIFLYLRTTFIVFSVSALIACTSNRLVPQSEKTVPENLYFQAKEEMDAGRWEKAIKKLQSLSAAYPVGGWGIQAELDLAYAEYKAGEKEAAIGTLDRFIKSYPNHSALDYAFYLKGVVHLNNNQNQGFVFSLSGESAAERDQKAARNAFFIFKELTKRFPKSRYTPDAVSKMHYLVNILAKNELYIADYYYRRGAYLAAANRAQTILTDFPSSTELEKALQIMIASYKALGLHNIEQDTVEVLAKNFPNSSTQKTIR